MFWLSVKCLTLKNIMFVLRNLISVPLINMSTKCNSFCGIFLLSTQYFSHIFFSIFFFAQFSFVAEQYIQNCSNYIWTIIIPCEEFISLILSQTNRQFRSQQPNVYLRYCHHFTMCVIFTLLYLFLPKDLIKWKQTSWLVINILFDYCFNSTCLLGNFY